MTRSTYASIRPQAPANQLVREALGMLSGGSRALDVGAGSLGDTRLLLDAGLHVDAVDIDRFSTDCAVRIRNPRLRALCSDIRDMDLGERVYCLVVAIHVLPFIPRDQLASVCARLAASLHGDGVLCATLFGVRDAWAQLRPHMSFVGRGEIASLFPGLSIVSCREHEYLGRDVHGSDKQWHVIRIILQRAN